jgi:hypothetical protein
LDGIRLEILPRVAGDKQFFSAGGKIQNGSGCLGGSNRHFIRQPTQVWTEGNEGNKGISFFHP